MGSFTIILSCLFYSVLALLVKPLSYYCNGLFISGFRFLIGIILGFAVLFFTKNPLKIVDGPFWVLRGVYGAIAMIAYFVAIQLTNSGRATLLSNTYPVFVAVFGTLFFGERITKRNIVSLSFCLMGVFMVLYDRGHYPILGDLLGILSGVCGALAVIYLKKSCEHNSSVIIYLSACFFGVLSLPFATNQIANINIQAFVILILVGILGFAGQVLMTFGFKTVSANQGSILSYATIPITLMLSYVVFGDPMPFKFLAGIGLILAGLMINSIE